MQPTYQPGDWLMVKWGDYALKASEPTMIDRIGVLIRARVGVDDVVVVERPEQPGILYIKRITEINEDTNQIYISSDNPEGNDSRQWGWLPVQAVRARVTSRVRNATKK